MALNLFLQQANVRIASISTNHWCSFHEMTHSHLVMLKIDSFIFRILIRIALTLPNTRCISATKPSLVQFQESKPESFSDIYGR